MPDFQIWLFASLFLNVCSCIVAYLKNTFSVEIFDFVVFVAAISYIILKRYTEGQWAAIPLIWLAGMSVAAVLLLMAETKAQERQKKSP